MTRSTIYHPNRRKVLAGIGAAGASVLGAPNIARAQDNEIPIGVLLPFTGSQGAYGPDMRKAAEITTKLIGDAGGILGGRKFKLFFEDDESTPTAGLTATKKLLEINGCQAVIGIWGSPIAMAIKNVLIQANACMMVSGAANAITDGDTKGLVWRYQAKATDWGPAMAQAMISRKWKSISILRAAERVRNSHDRAGQEGVREGRREGVGHCRLQSRSALVSCGGATHFGASPAPEAVMSLGLLTDFVSIVREVVRNDYKSKIMALSIMADAEGKFIQSIGADVAEGIEHFQPSPPLGSPNYARFQKLMGADANALFLFAGNTHDQICTLALAMEKTKSTDPLVYTKAIRELCNGPGQKVDDVAEALKLVRAGTKIDFVGAGSDCDFDERGDQLNRHYGHFRIEKGKQVLVQIIKGV